MKELEDRLSSVKKTEVRVDRFRHDLRRDLLESLHRRPAGILNYKAAFAASSMLTIVLAGLLVLFIIEPTYPLQLHHSMVASDRSTTANGGTGSMTGGVVRPLERIETPAFLDGSLEADQTYVKQWAEQLFDDPAVSIEPIDRPYTYTVSRFRLDKGKKFVQVYTLIPGNKLVHRVSY